MGIVGGVAFVAGAAVGVFAALLWATPAAGQSVAVGFGLGLGVFVTGAVARALLGAADAAVARVKEGKP